MQPRIVLLVLAKCYRCNFSYPSIVRIVIDTYFVIIMNVSISYSFGLDRSSSGHMNGRRLCDTPLTLSITGSWLARKIHMMKPSTGTFHSHNFRVVSAFILHGVLPA